MRNNGSFSERGRTEGIIDAKVTPQNANGAFVARGTRVAIDKIESSWDFENGYRMRLYLRVPINGLSHSFFLERNTLNKGNLGDFVNSMLQPCR